MFTDLVVEHEVLKDCGDTLRLHAANVSGRQRSAERRRLPGEVFAVAGVCVRVRSVHA